MWTHGHIGDVLTLIQNGVNCKQDKSGVGNKITRIETIADSSVNYEKTGFAELDDKQKAKALLESGDILFSHINSPIHVGKTAIYDGQEPLFHGINLLRLRTIEQVDSSYFNMFLVSLFQSGYWKRTAKQSVNQASVNQTDIKSVPFSYPPLAEQQRIVAKLDAAFAEIDRAVEVARDKTALSVELEKKFLQTNFDEKNFDAKDVCSLEQVAKFNSGNTPSKKNPDFWNGDFPWISAKDLKSEELSESIDKITQHAVKCGAAKIAGRGNLLVLVRGMGLLNGIAIGELQRDCAFNQDIKALVPKPSLNSRFLLLLLKARFLNLDSYLTSAAHGTAKVEFELIKKTRVVVPPLPQQLELVERHKNLVKQCQNLFGAAESTVTELSSLKSAILSQELQPPQSEAA